MSLSVLTEMQSVELLSNPELAGKPFGVCFCLFPLMDSAQRLVGLTGWPWDPHNRLIRSEKVRGAIGYARCVRHPVIQGVSE